MLVDEMRRSIERCELTRLPEVSSAVWKAFGAAAITEDEAGELSQLIAARQVAWNAAKAAPSARRSVGTRPRTSASLERRRKWCASGFLPPAIAARFSPAENAVLAVIAAECGPTGEGTCDLAIAYVAALAGVSETTVRNAVRAAKALGLLAVEERRVTAFRSLTNLVRLYEPAWRSWLRHRAKTAKGGGCKLAQPTSIDSTTKDRQRPAWTRARAAGGTRAGSAAPTWHPQRFAAAGAGPSRGHAP
ncbi:transcriptional regulator [Methylobacterium segetis]|uniref:transcriptional regulator n=1 Tax=Methylobacterium segetis TaxID=2488750 RepID=UPI001A9E0324|nr:transcriptional regulator [Methylobacterium segetis]